MVNLSSASYYEWRSRASVFLEWDWVKYLVRCRCYNPQVICVTVQPHNFFGRSTLHPPHSLPCRNTLVYFVVPLHCSYSSVCESPSRCPPSTGKMSSLSLGNQDTIFIVSFSRSRQLTGQSRGVNIFQVVESLFRELSDRHHLHQSLGLRWHAHAVQCKGKR